MPALPQTILVVEDEASIAETIVYALRTEGFAPCWTATGREALETAGNRKVALVILDLGLPDMSGFDVCRELRRRSAVPIIFLTARGGEIDRVVGLELGADDYVAKPFSPRELTARVRAILRRTQNGMPENMANADGPLVASDNPAGDNTKASRAGLSPSASTRPPAPAGNGKSGNSRASDWEHDPVRCRITYRGKPLELTRNEYRLLQALVAAPGRVFSREQLMTAAWDDPTAAMDRTVDAHIKSLRAKVREQVPDADPIVTHRGLGYSLREEA